MSIISKLKETYRYRKELKAEQKEAKFLAQKQEEHRLSQLREQKRQELRKVAKEKAAES